MERPTLPATKEVDNPLLVEENDLSTGQNVHFHDCWREGSFRAVCPCPVQFRQSASQGPTWTIVPWTILPRLVPSQDCASSSCTEARRAWVPGVRSGDGSATSDRLHRTFQEMVFNGVWMLFGHPESPLVLDDLSCDRVLGQTMCSEMASLPGSSAALNHYM